MDAATITAICTGIVGIIGAIGGIIVAVSAHSKASTAQQAANVATGVAQDAKTALDQHKSVHIVGGTENVT